MYFRNVNVYLELGEVPLKRAILFFLLFIRNKDGKRSSSKTS
jgi:hypothetical protein